ncbi:MAG TPA: ABC transporter permease [Candidatus Eisenbergiella stercorigallinarum]|uniref:ABC transporter permease n=1 Tax=Candidatus Eisenbergiella stercorigallinarum TaxID=2838557 RepID=A0A9D2R068_9FIRM|nr:ABC transporter permease [Candidatus Eisenbergiella stercorigallinarum]
MRLTEIFRLVWLNLASNKFKVILTSTGIIVGSATIMLVIAIGTGGREEVVEQFKNLNAGAIDITYEYQGNDFGGGMPAGGGMPGGAAGGGPSGGAPGGAPAGGMPSGGGAPGGGMPDFGAGMFGGFFGGGREEVNTERITLSTDDLEDILAFVPGVEEGCLSFTVTSTVDGGELEESASYTVAGVQSNYAALSNMELVIGEFLDDDDDTYKEKVCVLGYDAAREIFGSVYDAYNGTVYIDNRPYQVIGILNGMGTVSSGISPDSAIFIPYETGLKYLAGSNVSPTLTVIAQDVDHVDAVIADVETVLGESYPNAEFTISDAGSRMEAASASNDTLTMLLVCMAVIVFIVGGLGIMNVLFVSVKERTNEIGILKAIGCSRKDILEEFLLEASCTSLIGAILGVMLALGLTPALERFGVTISLSVSGGVLSLVFGVLTGTVFGFYPAYQASRMIPVEALNHE